MLPYITLSRVDLATVQNSRCIEKALNASRSDQILSFHSFQNFTVLLPSHRQLNMSRQDLPAFLLIDERHRSPSESQSCQTKQFKSMPISGLSEMCEDTALTTIRIQAQM